MFQSRRTLELLDRGLTVTEIGEGVRDLLDSYPNITSAVCVARDEQVRFTCNSEAATAGIVLVFDYKNRAWYWNEVPAGDGEAFVDAAMVDGVYTLLAPDGTVYREDTTTCLDDADYVDTDIILAPISPAGPQGWYRLKDVRLLGTSLANHNTVVSIARDHSSSYEQTKTFSAGSDVTTPSTHERARVAVKHQKGQAYTIRIQDTVPANTTAYPVGNGAGLVLENIALYVQPKRALPRDSASRKG